MIFPEWMLYIHNQCHVDGVSTHSGLLDHTQCSAFIGFWSLSIKVHIPAQICTSPSKIGCINLCRLLMKVKVGQSGIYKSTETYAWCSSGVWVGPALIVASQLAFSSSPILFASFSQYFCLSSMHWLYMSVVTLNLIPAHCEILCLSVNPSIDSFAFAIILFMYWAWKACHTAGCCGFLVVLTPDSFESRATKVGESPFLLGMLCFWE